MKTMDLVKKALVLAVLASFVIPLVVQAGPMVNHSCSQRPLSDFLDAQGTFNNPPQFFPPVPDYVGSADNALITFALVDYSGIAAAYIEEETGVSLGTEMHGSVLECSLDDGRVKVSVVLETTNALGFAQSIAELEANDFDFANTPTIFGNKAVDVAAGADPAVGPASFRLSFTLEAPGTDLPDYYDVINNVPNYAPVTVDFRSTTIGRLPDGTKARLRVQQVGATDGSDDVVWTREIVEINKK